MIEQAQDPTFTVGQIWRTRNGHLRMIFETSRHNGFMFAINKRGHMNSYYPDGDAVREIYIRHRPCVKDLVELVGMADDVQEGVPFRKYIRVLD